MTSGSYRGVRVAVIGAAGFIGSWVARALAREGAGLLLAVRRKAAAEPVLDRYGVSGEIFELDLTDHGRVREFLERASPAIVFNAAGYGVDSAERDPLLAHEVNTVLPVALAGAGARLVHVGSGIESWPPPDSLYARTKLAGTAALERFCLEHGSSALTARLFNVYGPGEIAGRLLPTLLEAARRGTEVPLTDGRQRKDFIHVEDVAEALLRLGAAAPPAAHTIVNVGTGRLISVRRFAETAADILGIPRSKLLFGALPARPGEPRYAAVSLESLRAIAGWTPAIDIAEGIARAVRFERELSPLLPGVL